MTDDTLTRLLEVDPTQVWLFLGDVLRNPTANLTAFVLILGLITGAVLLIILVLIALATGETSTDSAIPPPQDDGVPFDREGGAASAREGGVATNRRIPAGVYWMPLWLLAFGVIWVAGGFVSGRDAVCLSCHIDDSVHVLRLEDPTSDPHGDVDCVLCHETPNRVAAVTTAVPRRAVHYVTAAVRESSGAGYGVPVANHTCAYCHTQALAETRENLERGVRVSHVEPLEARALCSDCHVLQQGSGVIDSRTVGMEPCLRCHDAETASAECSYCHTRDVGYAVRARSAVEPRNLVSDITCGGCHSEESCDACHGIRMPHTAAFMGPGHARAAVEDIWFNNGRVCNRCHTSTTRPCARCHRGSFPSHGEREFARDHQSADPYNNGCDNCHGYNAWRFGRNFCATCHPRYAPDEIVIPQPY